MSDENKQSKKIALFLGAGASKPFGKPTTKELKEILREKYHDDTQLANWQKRNYHCIDGFNTVKGWSGGRKWDKGKYEAQLADGEIPVYLYKLHGSTDWKRHKKHRIVATGEEGPSSDKNYIEPMLVYPTLSPKDGRGVKPYKTIREKFKEQLMKRTDVCIVIGFSFRDEHINSIFSKFLKLGTKTLIVVSPSAEKNINENLLKKGKDSQTLWTSSGKDKKDIRRLNDQNGNEIIAINDGIDADNAENIIHRIFSFLPKQHSGGPEVKKAKNNGKE
jgi:hypothetical protein